ncbi:uncharacterized protein JN550_002973 [Neoarthrinium moseri]|uniref:uncharacterized protein n=1 Tax=Neoarthrinium moseri TaxID=1658444 RepID=UPI001FDCEBA0|nr:uncharacterized protein JN550_002973 [Neoarthrinium moseri]KAI1873704.1 hypothetical protein JN550_002973 [Neoarthrinium moseri]
MLGHFSLGLLVVWACALVNTVVSVPVASTTVSNTGDQQKTASIRAADGVFRGRRHGPSEMRRTFNKYNIPIHENLHNAVNRYLEEVPADQTGSVPATSIEGDLEFVAPVGIGTPAQILSLDFDTGSADTWVFSNDTQAKAVKGQEILDLSKSTTAQQIPNCTWSIIYGDFSSSSGLVYRDTFTLGDLSIPNMTIESAQSVSQQLSKQKAMSGLVGLAFGSIIQTTPVQKAFLDFLPDVLKNPVFTVDLRHNSSDGSYNFGFIDDSLHTGDLEYINVDSSDGFWSVQMKGFATQGSAISYEFAAPPAVILDTGSTLFYAPDQAVKQYYKTVPGANFSYEEYGWIIPCNATPPSFLWELADANGTVVQGELPGDYLVYSRLNATLSPGAPPDYCYSGLQTLGGFTSLEGIFGDVFLKAGFQVFDVARKRVGFAPKALPGIQHPDPRGGGDDDDAEAHSEGAKRAVEMPKEKIMLY